MLSPFYGATTNDNNTQSNHENSKLQLLTHGMYNYMCPIYSNLFRCEGETLSILHSATGCLDKTRAVLQQAKPI